MSASKARARRAERRSNQELDTYKEALDNLSPHFTHHVVEKGETLYSLSKSTGLPIDTITKYNATELRDGLKLGSILKLPLPPGAVKAGAGATVGSDVHGDTSGSLGVGSGVAGRVSGDHGTGTAPQGPGWPSATGEQRYTETVGNQAVDPAGFPSSYPAADTGAYPCFSWWRCPHETDRHHRARSGWQCCSRCAWEVRPTAVTWNFTKVYCWRSTS